LHSKKLTSDMYKREYDLKAKGHVGHDAKYVKTADKANFWFGMEWPSFIVGIALLVVSRGYVKLLGAACGAGN